MGRWFFFVVSLTIVQLHLVFFTPFPHAPSCVLHTTPFCSPEEVVGLSLARFFLVVRSFKIYLKLSLFTISRFLSPHR